MPIDQLTAGEEGILSSHSLHTEPLSLDNSSSTRFGVTNEATKKLFKSIRLSEKKQHLLASVVLVPLDHFSLVLVLVFGFEIILVSISSSTASL